MSNTITALEEWLTGTPTGLERFAVLISLIWELRIVDTQRAFLLSKEAVGLARRMGTDADLAPSLCLRGICATRLLKLQEARLDLEKSLVLSRRFGDRQTEARCLLYVGRGCYLKAEYEEAIESISASLQIYEKLDDGSGLGEGMNLMGAVHSCLCDYGQALEWYTRSLSAWEQLQNDHGINQALNNIGGIYAEMKEYELAVEIHRRCLEQTRHVGDSKAEVLALINLGHDYLSLGSYMEALKVTRQAVELSVTQGTDSIDVVPNQNMGLAYAGLGRSEEALACYTQALKTARAIQNRDFTAYILLDIGLLKLEIGDSTAPASLTEALEIAQTVGARKTALRASHALSDFCKGQGDYAAALRHYETFYRLEKEVFSEEADKRTQALVVQMQVEHHRREAEALAGINAALQTSNEALQEANARLEALSTTDPLTGLPNHRALVVALDTQTAVTRRTGRPCALLFLDIDHFKSFNDTYGHPVGDAVLVEFAACARACLRQEDTLGRWGGEEFLILLPGTEMEEALEIGERIRAEVAARPLSAEEGLSMTCSIGAAACPPQEAHRDVLVEAADQALYAAKRLGRNQVRGAGDPAILMLPGPLFPSKSERSRQDRRSGIAPSSAGNPRTAQSV